MNGDDVSGIRGDISNLSKQVGEVHKEVSAMKTETAVYGERLTNHLKWHEQSGKLSPIAGIVIKVILGSFTVGALGILALGIKEWLNK